MYSKTIPAGLLFCIFLCAFTAFELFTPNDTNADGLNKLRMFNSINNENEKVNVDVLVWGNIQITKDPSGKNIIQWSTLKENNKSEFLIQHSNNGHTFKAFKRIVAIGKTDRPYQYQAADKNSNGYNFYRIIGINKSGKVVYSKVVSTKEVKM